MNLNPKIEEFYKEILLYSGLTVGESGEVVVNSESKTPIKYKDGRVFHLPYMELLKNPDGKKFFHPLNENYIRPEGEGFIMYRDNLLMEINSKLTYLIGVLIDIASRPDLQKGIKSRELIDLLSLVGSGDGSGVSDVEAEMATILMEKVMPKAMKDRPHAPFIDVFLCKDGHIGEEDFLAVGKVNFVLSKELDRALNEKEYKIFGQTVRKKDIIVYRNALRAIFPNLDNQDDYSAGSDNVVFGYLNALLATSYIVTNRLNEVMTVINKDLSKFGMLSDADLFKVDWVNLLEDMYGMTKEIRFIPNQDDVSESKSTKKLKVNESKVKDESLIQKPVDMRQVQQQNQMPVFNPPQQQPQQQMTAPQQQVQQPQQPQQQPQQAPRLEQMIGSMGQGFVNYQQQQSYQQHGIQPGMPSWLQQEMMARQQPQNPQQPPQFAQPYPNQQYGMMGNNPMQYQQPMQQPMQQGYGNAFATPYPQQGYNNFQSPQQGYYPNQYPQNFQQGYYNGYGQPRSYDAFSQIEPSSLNGG